MGLVSFQEYFNDQWCKKFHNWKIYNSPHGLASTNNPVESINKLIKQYFTNYISKPLLEIVRIIVEQFIPFWCNSEKEWKNIRPFSPELKKNSNLLISYQTC